MSKRIIAQYYAKIGLRIKERRKEAGLSQEALADRINITPEYLGKIERGERMPSTPVLIELSKKLGRSIDYFLMDQPHVDPKYELCSELAKITKGCNSLQMHLIIENAKIIAGTPMTEEQND